MTTAATTLLGLGLPVTGELSGTWGDVVNNSITNLLDTAIAGTTPVRAMVLLVVTEPTEPVAASPVPACVTLNTTVPTAPAALTPVKATVLSAPTVPTSPAPATPVRLRVPPQPLAPHVLSPQPKDIAHP